MKVLEAIGAILLVIGGLNWGLIGFFDFNLIAAIFGEGSVISHLIYALVGISAVFEVLDFVFGFKSMQHRWCEMSPVKEYR
jgi:uncharacterized membrane protein YuzA (DUF378 family)